MPKPTKLHMKGKTVSMQKPCKDQEGSSDPMDSESAMRQYELELCWCIQQLERSLNNKKATEPQLQETWKVLQVLKNNNQPIIRKRQLMRSHFGDYRAKMLTEEKKLAKMTSKMKISEKPENPKATFLRKSAFLSTGDSSFRFNFDLAPEQIDNSNTENPTINTIISKADNTTVSNAGENGPTTEENLKSFKFLFSGSEFKFNFDVDKS